jgi:DNA-binding NarL/FixJ family response regulator
MGTVRILVADDHETIRKGVRSILSERKSIEVSEAATGKEAVDRAREASPDLLILDINMPGMGGLEAAREIRSFLPNVPILFFTMHEGIHLIQEAKLVGAQGFVTKSQASETLLNAVDALIHNDTFFPTGESTH